MSKKFPYQDASLPVARRIEDLIGRMTIEEKAGQLCQVDGRKEPEKWIKEKFIGSFLHVLGEEANRLQDMALNTRMGIPLLLGIDAIHGNCFYKGATVFPTQLALSSSWNREIIETMGRITAKEVLVTGVHWTFSPVFCLTRDLRWGRVDETFGEDPFLVGELGKALIKGYQGDSISDPGTILACAKHYAGYSDTLGGRDATEAEFTHRKFLTYFLPPFEEAVKAGCSTFMTAYQCIDGTPAVLNTWLLKEILRERWGFEGFVVTDWNNIGNMKRKQFIVDNKIDHAVESLKAGNDMAMMTPDFSEAIVEAVKSGRLEEYYLDVACKRILKAKFELGLFDEKKLFVDPVELRETICCIDHQKTALEAAYQSMVLLKNKENILPFKESIRRIAVIGPNANDYDNMLGDWSRHSFEFDGADEQYHPEENLYTVLRGIRRRASEKCEVLYHKGCGITHDDSDDIFEAARITARADAVILVIGDSLEQTGERKDRANLNLSGKQEALVEAVFKTGTRIITVLINSKPLSIPEVVDKSDAVLEAWNPGMQGGNAVAGVLFGDRNPEGRLTVSFPYHVGQLPVHYDQIPGWHGGRYCDMPAEPLFAFGYGLSYTTFSYNNLSLKKRELKAGESLEFSVEITNTGEQEGHEVVQVYVNDLYSSVSTPAKVLKDFRRIFLKPGEKQTVVFSLLFQKLALINRDLEKVVEPGTFVLMVGSSSRDIDLMKEEFQVI